MSRDAAYRQAAREGQVRSDLATRSLQEIADRFGVTLQTIQASEQSALRKLREHPLMRQLAREFGIPVHDE
jgi:DNA-directed RNA polymerase sigma subunit (sigma70/sigma32)